MAIPYRGTTSASTYFITAGTYDKVHVLQSGRMAELFCQVMFRYRDQGKFYVHAFVVMPNHIHLLITVPDGMTLERAVQLIKGGFSFEAGRVLGLRGSIWQKSYVDRRVRDATEAGRFRNYIHQNPVRANLVDEAGQFPYSSLSPEFRLDELPQRLKPSEAAAFMHR